MSCEYRELIYPMDINQALSLKLKESAFSADSAWRVDFEELYNSIDPINPPNFNIVFKQVTNLTIAFIALKKALLIKSLKDNLDVKFTDINFEKLLSYATVELSSEKYLHQFNTFKSCIEMKYHRFGIKFEFDTNLMQSLYISGVKNTSSRLVSDLKADWVIIENQYKSSTIQSFNDVIELKPNIGGLGINLNALISKLIN
jgi:hypothetical protein